MLDVVTIITYHSCYSAEYSACLRAWPRVRARRYIVRPRMQPSTVTRARL